jgi:PPOX class probable F420-dependent enzyme
MVAIVPGMGANQRADVVMSEAEIAGFLAASRVATIATLGPTGHPHLVAMWFGVIDGKLYFETKAKSQKAVNLRRNPIVSCSVEAGGSYDQLRGVAIEGEAVLLDDTTSDEYWAAAVNIWERYQGPYTEDVRPFVELMMNKRIVIRVEPRRVRSWDHRKLGLDPMPVSGSTAPAG